MVHEPLIAVDTTMDAQSPLPQLDVGVHVSEEIAMCHTVWPSYYALSQPVHSVDWVDPDYSLWNPPTRDEQSTSMQPSYDVCLTTVREVRHFVGNGCVQVFIVHHWISVERQRETQFVAPVLDSLSAHSKIWSNFRPAVKLGSEAFQLLSSSNETWPAPLTSWVNFWQYEYSLLTGNRNISLYTALRLSHIVFRPSICSPEQFPAPRCRYSHTLLTCLKAARMRLARKNLHRSQFYLKLSISCWTSSSKVVTNSCSSLSLAETLEVKVKTVNRKKKS